VAVLIPGQLSVISWWGRFRRTLAGRFHGYDYPSSEGQEDRRGNRPRRRRYRTHPTWPFDQGL